MKKTGNLARVAAGSAIVAVSILGGPAHAAPASFQMDLEQARKVADAEAVLDMLVDISTIDTQPECTDFSAPRNLSDLGI